MATNKEQKITITASTGLSKEEAERMKKEADEHASEDKSRLSEVEARNKLDSLIYQGEKLINENREKLAEADIKAAEAAIEQAKSTMKEGGIGEAECRFGCLDQSPQPHRRSNVQGAAERPARRDGGSTRRWWLGRAEVKRLRRVVTSWTPNSWTSTTPRSRTKSRCTGN